MRYLADYLMLAAACVPQEGETDPPHNFLRANRERVLARPVSLRPPSLQFLSDLRESDLDFLVRYHEEQAAAARIELAVRSQ